MPSGIKTFMRTEKRKLTEHLGKANLIFYILVFNEISFLPRKFSWMPQTQLLVLPSSFPWHRITILLVFFLWHQFLSISEIFLQLSTFHCHLMSFLHSWKSLRYCQQNSLPLAIFQIPLSVFYIMQVSSHNALPIFLIGMNAPLLTR